LEQLATQGVDHITCGNGPRVDLVHLLHALGERGVNDLLIEGGEGILGSLFDAGLVDSIAAFIAPIIVGGASAPGPVGGEGCSVVAQARRVSNVRMHRLGADLLLTGAVARATTAEVA